MMKKMMKRDMCYKMKKKMQKTLNCKRKTLNPTNAQNLEKKKNLVGAKYLTLINAMLVITSLVQPKSWKQVGLKARFSSSYSKEDEGEVRF